MVNRTLVFAALSVSLGVIMLLARQPTPLPSEARALVIVDRQGRIQTWCSEAVAMTGYEFGEVYMKPIVTLMPPDRREEHVLMFKHCRDYSLPVNGEIRAKDGSKIQLALSMKSLPGEDEQRYWGTLRR